MIQWYPLAAIAFAAWGVLSEQIDPRFVPAPSAQAPFAQAPFAQAPFAQAPFAQERGAQETQPGPWGAEEPEWAEESELAQESTSRIPLGPDGEARLWIDEGRSPHVATLRLSLAGAPPNSWAILELGEHRGRNLAGVARSLVAVDGEGRAQLTWTGARGARLGARVLTRRPGGPTRWSPIASLPAAGGGTRALPPQRGDIVITEIMKDPNFVGDSHGEWFELQNVTNRVINIAGWKISDLGSNSHTILNGVQPILLVPGQRLVLGNDADLLTNGGVIVDYEYANFTLGNAADSILLTSRNLMLVDEVDYDDGILWPDVPGKSLSLHPLSTDASLNDDPTQWCPGSSFMASGSPDMGTPGQANDLCP
jgi:hypothetical protein